MLAAPVDDRHCIDVPGKVEQDIASADARSKKFGKVLTRYSSLLVGHAGGNRVSDAVAVVDHLDDPNLVRRNPHVTNQQRHDRLTN